MWIFIQSRNTLVCDAWPSPQKSHPPSVATNTIREQVRISQIGGLLAIAVHRQILVKSWLRVLGSEANALKVDPETSKWECSLDDSLLPFSCLFCNWLLGLIMVATSETFSRRHSPSRMSFFQKLVVVNQQWEGGMKKARLVNAPLKCFPTTLLPIGLAGRGTQLKRPVQNPLILVGK